MRTIHKFPLERSGRQLVVMPKGAVALAVGMQSKVPCIWAEVNTTAENTDRVVFIKTTGSSLDDVPSDCSYLGTAFAEDAMLVFHIFIEKE